MPRGDVNLDFDTNDLIISKSLNNVISENSWKYDGATGNVVVSILIDRKYADGANDFDDWRTVNPASNKLLEIDSVYNGSSVHISYSYIDSKGLLNSIGSFIATSRDYSGTLQPFNVYDWNIYTSSVLSNQSIIFSYEKNYVDSGGTQTAYESMYVRKAILGDFVVEDNKTQNEYILLNINEGSLLQNPLQGVGLQNYIQSPSSNESLVNAVVEKFALDSLRVIGIQKTDDNLTIESEDYNIK